MRSLKTMFVIAAFGAVVAAGPAFAQAADPQAKPTTPPAANPQKPTTPPAAETQKPAEPTPAQPPRPFPEGAKVAYVSIQFIASNSIEGKAATARLDDLKKKLNADLVAKGNQLKASQDKLQSGGSVMSESARTQLEKEIEKLQRDIQFAQQDAQTEVNELTERLQNDFQVKLNPVIEAVRAEKGLLMIFAVPESGIVAADTGLDLSQEVVKRFDASAKTPAKK